MLHQTVKWQMVSKNGKITAKGKGSCSIYVYATNGCAQKIKVVVKLRRDRYKVKMKCVGEKLPMIVIISLGSFL